MNQMNQSEHGLWTPGEKIAFTPRSKIHSHSQILAKAEAYFVCHIGPIFQISLGVRSPWKWAFTLAIKGPAINTNGLIYNLCKLHDKLEYHSFPTLFLFLRLIGGSITWYLHTHRANLLRKISVIIAASFYYAKTWLFCPESLCSLRDWIFT